MTEPVSEVIITADEKYVFILKVLQEKYRARIKDGRVTYVSWKDVEAALWHDFEKFKKSLRLLDGKGEDPKMRHNGEALLDMVVTIIEGMMDLGKWTKTTKIGE